MVVTVAFRDSTPRQPRGSTRARGSGEKKQIVTAEANAAGSERSGVACERAEILRQSLERERRGLACPPVRVRPWSGRGENWNAGVAKSSTLYPPPQTPLPTPPRCRNTHIRCTCCSGGASTTIAAASLPRACFHPVGSGVQAVVQAVGSATRAGSELSSAVTDEAGSHPWTSPYSRLRYVSIYVYSSNQRLAVLCVEAALVSSVEECASITCGETTLLPYGQNISLRASKIVALPSRSFSFTLPTCYATKW